MGHQAMPRRTGWQLATVLVCLAGGLLLGTARAYSHGEDIDSRSADLSGLVRDAQQRIDTAQAKAAGLQLEIDQAAAGDLTPQVAKARSEASALGPGAGMTAVTGPALRVTLTDAKRDTDGNYPAGVDPDNLVVHQQDLQSVVNALWAGGAEAMMIMDQRVITTSAVRCIGNTLLLQGRTYSPPFVVTAIGEAAAMQDALALAPGVRLFRQYVDAYDLGFDVETLDTVVIPGYPGPIRMTAVQENR